MSRDRKPRMTKNRLLLIQTLQKGLRQVREAFIDVKQYTEERSVHERRRIRFLAKQKYLKERGIE
ncbi:hypothetical protein ES703_27094 [subsurface metagenome]